MIGRFRSTLFASFFQGPLVVAIIMIDGSEKHNRSLDFELRSSRVIERQPAGVRLVRSARGDG